MKNIENCIMEKYSTDLFTKVEDFIYQVRNKYVTTISFYQEPRYGEGKNAGDISTYPLKDICFEYSCTVCDYYPELNTPDSKKCYIEFLSSDLDKIRAIRDFAGKHVYNRNRGKYVELVVEDEPPKGLFARLKFLTRRK